jgi:hypothetical protein
MVSSCYSNEDFYVLKLSESENREQLRSYLLQLSRSLGFDLFEGGIQLSDSTPFTKEVELLCFGYSDNEDLMRPEISIDGVVTGKFYDQEVSDNSMFFVQRRAVILELLSGTPIKIQEEELTKALTHLSKTEVPRVFVMQR